jgi:FKBP-type peptidyl-prolyl cis-trans isomerase
MATRKSQRIGIWIIAIVLTLGTLGSFLVMGLSISNQKVDLAQYKKVQEQQKAAAQYGAYISQPLPGYSTRIFDAASVTKLNVEILTEGTGDVVKTTDTINCSYFGWMADGKVFDSSNKASDLKTKVASDKPTSFALSSVIAGWTEGLTGVKVGSVVRLTIPAAKAYGAQESGIIPANSPLEFIVIVHKIG